MQPPCILVSTAGRMQIVNLGAMQLILIKSLKCKFFHMDGPTAWLGFLSATLNAGEQSIFFADGLQY